MADAMKQKILKLLKELEQKHDVKILFAVESGSREWGFASEDSDYDVRAVHFGSVERYLGMHPPKENIEVLVEDGEKIDIVSWDIKKFAHLLLSSNPTVSEWLQSDIVYVESPRRSEFRDIFEAGFSPFTLKKHYLAVAENNYDKYIKGQHTANLKKYVYVLRALACYEFLEARNSLPPLNYKKVISYLPKEAAGFMEEVVRRKQASESTEGPANKSINELIEIYFKRKVVPADNKFDKDEVNDLVVKIIKEAK